MQQLKPLLKASLKEINIEEEQNNDVEITPRTGLIGFTHLNSLPIHHKAQRTLYKWMHRRCSVKNLVISSECGRLSQSSWLLVIRPVLEYAAPAWNHLLTKTQIDQTEAIQRQALRIIYSYTSDMSYTSALYCAAVPSLADRREHLAWKFSKSVIDPSSCLFTLLPTPRDPSITTRLRCANKFPHISTRTRKYQTFISYALSHYQSAHS